MRISVVALRLVIAVQLLSIALVGGWARDVVPSSLSLEWVGTLLLPALLYGAPLFAIFLGQRARLSRGRLGVLVALEIALTLIALLALLPAVQ
jgi:hypothetical protein